MEVTVGVTVYAGAEWHPHGYLLEHAHRGVHRGGEIFVFL